LVPDSSNFFSSIGAIAVRDAAQRALMSALMPESLPQSPGGRRSGYALALCAAVLVAGGCASSSEWVKVRDTPRNPLAGSLDLLAPGGPKPTDRTMQLLRRYDLAQDLDGDRAILLARLEDIQRREPSREHEYAMAEVAYITAKQAEKLHRGRALEFYGTALIHAYRYLFEYESDPGMEEGRGRGRPGSLGSLASNPYDPQFRGASDLYNQSLEGMLRLVRQEGELRPGMSRTVKTSNHTCSFDVVLYSTGWHAEDFDRFEFVSDYTVKGMKNHYHSYGLGVPLIAVRRGDAGGRDSFSTGSLATRPTSPVEKESPPLRSEHFYPPNAAFPITAFLRVDRPGSTAGPAEGGRDSFSTGDVDPMAGSPVEKDSRPLRAAPLATDPQAPRFVLELHDPLDRQTIAVADRTVPLEADLSTPLAYFLNQPQFQDSTISTLGLLRPGEAKQLQGLYMLEPFDSHKMPVVMVHGLWSADHLDGDVQRSAERSAVTRALPVLVPLYPTASRSGSSHADA
jgi:hypothetical protein